MLGRPGKGISPRGDGLVATKMKKNVMVCCGNSGLKKRIFRPD
jgi:hypothetical protein